MGDAPEFVKIRHIANCQKVATAYGKGVAAALGIPLDKVNQLKLNTKDYLKRVIQYTKVGIG
jgi:hypothetical protein